MITLIAAMDEHGLIGKNGKLPWHCKEDLKHFHAMTLHQNLLMGRTTFEGLSKPFHDRMQYVVTHHEVLVQDNVKRCEQLHEFLENWKKNKHLFICGGASIYEQTYTYCDDMYISIIHGIYQGDTYMPEMDMSQFILETKQKKEGFTLYHYVRKVR